MLKMSEVFTRSEVEEKRLLKELFLLMELSVGDMDSVNQFGLDKHWHEKSQFVRLQSEQLLLSLSKVFSGLIAFVRTGKAETGQISLLEDPLHELLQLGLIIVLLQM